MHFYSLSGWVNTQLVPEQRLLSAGFGGISNVMAFPNVLVFHFYIHAHTGWFLTVKEWSPLMTVSGS